MGEEQTSKTEGKSAVFFKQVYEHYSPICEILYGYKIIFNEETYAMLNE